MSNKEKILMMELVLKSGLSDNDKVLQIQSCLLGWISFEEVKAYVATIESEGMEK